MWPFARAVVLPLAFASVEVGPTTKRDPTFGFTLAFAFTLALALMTGALRA